MVAHNPRPGRGFRSKAGKLAMDTPSGGTKILSSWDFKEAPPSLRPTFP